MSLRISSAEVLTFTGSQEVVDAVHNLRFIIAGRPEFPTPKYFAGAQEMYARHVFFHWIVDRFQGSLFYSLAKELGGEHGETGRFTSRRLFNAFIDGRLDIMHATWEAHKAVKELCGNKANLLGETRMTILFLEEVHSILNSPSITVESSMA
jgi:hypothetical protein